jgi:hypothetical protein
MWMGGLFLILAGLCLMADNQPGTGWFVMGAGALFVVEKMWKD